MTTQTLHIVPFARLFSLSSVVIIYETLRYVSLTAHLLYRPNKTHSYDLYRLGQYIIVVIIYKTLSYDLYRLGFNRLRAFPSR